MRSCEGSEGSWGRVWKGVDVGDWGMEMRECWGLAGDFLGILGVDLGLGFKCVFIG